MCVLFDVVDRPIDNVDGVDIILVSLTYPGELCGQQLPAA